MRTLKNSIRLRLIKLLNPILVTIPFAIGWFCFYSQNVALPYYNKGNWLIIVLFFILYITYGRLYDSFLISVTRISEMISSQC